MNNISAKKKSKFLTFCLSFLPGAAEMYMGFMRMGISIMALFFICFACITVGMDFLGPAAILVWFVGFFHANNIAGADDQKFAELKDCWIWEEFTDGEKISISDGKKRIAAATAFIIVGLLLLWNTMVEILDTFIPEEIWDYYYNTVRQALYYVPKLAISLIIIVIGIKLIKGKKKEILIEEQSNM